MMKLWAVSHTNWRGHKLETIFVKAEDWKGAVAQHPKLAAFTLHECSSLEDAKVEAFNCDCLFEAIEVPND